AKDPRTSRDPDRSFRTLRDRCRCVERRALYTSRRARRGAPQDAADADRAGGGTQSERLLGRQARRGFAAVAVDAGGAEGAGNEREDDRAHLRGERKARAKRWAQ